MPSGSKAVTIKGMDALVKKLAALPEAVDRGSRAAVRNEAVETAADMRRNAPRDTGKLQDSIQSEFDPKTITGRAVATAPHAHFVNDGTSRQPAQPFADQAAERSRRRFPKRVRQEVSREMGKLTS